MSDLQTFAARSCEAAGISEQKVASILAELTSTETKVAVAKKLVQEAARTLYQIPEGDIERLAEQFANPSTRREAEWRLGNYKYLDPSTEWAAHGYSLILDAIFAENEPLAECHIVAVPAEWGTSIWHGERDLGDDGYVYSHWVYADLPAIVLWDRSEPVACMLVSEDLCGSFHWGDRQVRLYRGELDVRPAVLASEILAELDVFTETTASR